MKDLYIGIIDRIVLETGYDPDYVEKRFQDSISRGVSPIDFFDDVVDERLFGKG